MEIPKIGSLTQALEWLRGRPIDWTMIVLSRLALRSLPTMVDTDHNWLKFYAVSIFRANLVAWASINDQAFEFKGATELADAALLEALRRAYDDNQAWYAIVSAANAMRYVDKDNSAHLIDGIEAQGIERNEVIEAMIFDAGSIQDDFAWLMENQKMQAVAEMTGLSLWLKRTPPKWRNLLTKLKAKLLDADAKYSIWIDWYERRIRGELAAFDIPGDRYRKEDKAILRRLAEATDEDFWGKGHEYVNATLKGWLDEARARAAPPSIQAEASGTFEITGQADGIVAPLQEPGALAYGINEQGKLDRLPVSDQVHLRDVPDQRRAYQDLRDAAAELLDEGQRLGHRLKRALTRFLQSLPERFEDAEAYLVWRDANALRRLHRAHREAAKNPDPDEAKLEPVVAEGLGGVLDLYNHFAFADDGLRAKDEARISPQERASAKAEAKAATPLVTAILATPDMATNDALDDIAADAESAELPADDPYADQVLDQSNRTKRNWIAGLLEGGKKALGDPELLGKHIVIGAAEATGATIVAGAANSIRGMNFAHPLNFIATNATLLQSYVAVAFSSYPHLPELIERMKLFWRSFGKK